MRASLNCVLFYGDALRNPHFQNMKNGDKVIARGPIEVYTKRGTFQLIVKSITPAGKGDFREEFEKLKKKLASEGLFDLDQKQKIPRYPKRIGLVTAEGGAALQDFLKITRRRTFWMDILLSPSLVQGEEAPRSLQRALALLIEYHHKAPPEKKLDVIVLARGGGSLEDLWAFNDEGLAQDIYRSPLPIISAVGHEVDFSISDMVADHRSETPSSAAEILSLGQMKLRERLHRLKQGLQGRGREIFHQSEKRVERANITRRLMEFTAYHEKTLELEDMGHQLQKKGKDIFYDLKKRIERGNITGRLVEFTGYHKKVLKLENLKYRLPETLPRHFMEQKTTLQKNHEMLRALNPENILGRGYTYLKDSDGHIVGQKKALMALPSKAILSVKFHDGDDRVQKMT